ncbi:hypothetical protein LCGC14_1473270 [marine sediment metagenome]|uniref:Uncharacterized protein n=1 Tax=marine sediment metagenome TaxID=412755 RepID=A0A0F9MDH8_9ZZZZ
MHNSRKPKKNPGGLPNRSAVDPEKPGAPPLCLGLCDVCGFPSGLNKITVAYEDSDTGPGVQVNACACPACAQGPWTLMLLDKRLDLSLESRAILRCQAYSTARCLAATAILELKLRPPSSIIDPSVFFPPARRQGGSG